MIERVVAIGFKGRAFRTPIGPKTLIVGMNGAGKSAIVQAMELALNGVTGGTHKTPQAIYDAFATPVEEGNNEMMVEARVANTDFARKYTKNGKTGAVSVALNVDRKKVDVKAFSFQLGLAGNTEMFNAEDFWGLSPEKMLGFLAAKFGGGDMDQILSAIDWNRQRVTTVAAKIREAEGYISRNRQGISDLNLPAGSLSEVEEEIKKLQAEKSKAEKALRKAEREMEAEEEAARKAEAEKAAQEEVGKDGGAIVIEDAAPAPPPVQRQPELFPTGPGFATPPYSQDTTPPRGAPKGRKPPPTVLESIKIIMDAIMGVGCPGCSREDSMAMIQAKIHYRLHGGKI